MKSVQQELLRNESIRDTIINLTKGLGFQTRDRKIYLLTAYFNIAVGHHEAIDFLIKEGLFCSAFALVRPIAETFYRFAWVPDQSTPAQTGRRNLWLDENGGWLAAHPLSWNGTDASLGLFRGR